MVLPSTRLKRLPVLGRIVEIPYLGSALVFLLDRVLGPIVGTVLAVLGPLLALLIDVVGRVVGLIVEYVEWWGVWYGAMAYAVGYGLLYVAVFVVAPSPPGWLEMLIDLVGISLPEVWLVAGWVFYLTHTVEIRIPDVIGSDTTNPLAGSPENVLFLYPALLLVIAGLLVARNRRDLHEAFLLGVSMVLSYFALMYWGADLLSFEANGVFRDYTVYIVVDTTFYTAATGYPLVFGTLGALIAIYFDVPYLSRIDDVPVVSRLNEVPSRVIELVPRPGDLPVISRFR